MFVCIETMFVTFVRSTALIPLQHTEDFGSELRKLYGQHFEINKKNQKEKSLEKLCDAFGFHIGLKWFNHAYSVWHLTCPKHERNGQFDHAVFEIVAKFVIRPAFVLFEDQSHEIVLFNFPKQSGGGLTFQFESLALDDSEEREEEEEDKRNQINDDVCSQSQSDTTSETSDSSPVRSPSRYSRHFMRQIQQKASTSPKSRGWIDHALSTFEEKDRDEPNGDCDSVRTAQNEHDKVETKEHLDWDMTAYWALKRDKELQELRASRNTYALQRYDQVVQERNETQKHDVEKDR